MTSIEQTAYPRLKRTLTPRELDQIYTPTPAELFLAHRTAKGPVATLGFLIHLKVFQRLGYPMATNVIPASIVDHIATCANISLSPRDLAGYDDSGTRRRHLPLIREVLDLKAYGPPARKAFLRAMVEAARTKDDLADLINVALEELIRCRFELPAFGTLDRAAHHAHAVVAHGIYRQVEHRLSLETRAALDALFIVEPGTFWSAWQDLKRDPASPTLTHMKLLIAHLVSISERRNLLAPHLFTGVPHSKIKQFAAEAKTLDAARMREMLPRKRYTLAAALLSVQSAQALDDLAEMLIKRMLAIHQKGKEALQQYHLDHQARTDALVTTLRDLVVAYRKEGSTEERFAAIEGVLGEQSEEVLKQCEEHLAYVGNAYQQFLWTFYKSHRATLFRLLSVVTFRATTQDTSMEATLRFLRQHEASRGDWLITAIVEEEGTPEEQRVELLDLSWVPDVWWKLLTGSTRRVRCPDRVQRRHFEVCVFSQLMWDLKSGDLYVEGSDHYADYRDQLLPWSRFQQELADYGKQVELPTDGKAFVAHVRAWLEERVRQTDASFPNEHVRIEKGEPIMRPPEKKPLPEGLLELEALLAERLAPVTPLEILLHTHNWLNWTRFFGPISGYDSKLANPVARYLTAVFCFGCNLGPSQTARSLDGVDRRDVTWVNQRHITLENLDEAIRLVIHAYHRLELPRFWGTGQHASADGTKWEMYEQNLLAEYHIRYGGYGGMGYYHVSDNYIARFSHFIPCGVWEGSFILDIFEQEDKEPRPEVLHGDTQAQSLTIFGMAYLLGIELMPRIRNWKDLKLSRPSQDITSTHIDELFSDTVDWDLIETHLPDMLRVVMSVAAGMIRPSTLLRKLGTYSRKNKLYQAFRELGNVVRTEFLLHLLADPELRSTLQSAMNKSEAFNGFAKWVLFGGEGVIAENRREEQRKIIKFNHLVANCVILYNVFVVSKELQQLAQEGREFDEQAIAALSPYIRHHINRFGHYQFDLAQQSPPLDYDLSIPTKKRQEQSPGQATVAKRKKKPKKKHKKTAARQMKLFEGEESL